MRDSKGKFTKGNTGRPKGAKDKLTQEAKELFIQTLEYFVPKKTHTELDTKDDIVISFKE